MDTLEVVYCTSAPEELGKKEMKVSPPINLQVIENLKNKINDGSVDRVYLVGKQVVIGWRIYVDRPVTFRQQEGVDDKLPEVENAKFRIVCKDYQHEQLDRSKNK